jgi:hypothetical protein
MRWMESEVGLVKSTVASKFQEWVGSLRTTPAIRA